MVFNNMRRAGAVLGLALVLLQSVPAITIDSDIARMHAEALRNTYPRPEGSAGEQEALAYITTALDRAGTPYEITDFSGLDDGHSFSRSVDITIPGESSETLLLMTPLGHPSEAGPDEDSSASLGATLALVESATLQPQRFTLRVLILGAEHGTGSPYPLGTRTFLRDYFPDAPVAGVYLDASQPGIVLETGGGGEVSPSWLMQALVQASREAGITPRVRAGLNQLHRLAISSAPEPLIRLLAAGIPAIYVASEQSEFGPSSVAESARVVALMLERLCAGFGAGIPSEWDRHYLYFNLGARQLVISEFVYLPILIGVVFFTLLYALISRRALGRYLRTIGRNFWNLPVLFVLIFGFLSAGTGLLSLFLLARSFPTLWQTDPAAYVGLKLALSLLLFSLAAQILRRLPLSKNGSFYSAAALLVLFIDVILFSILNLSFGYYFLWAFLAAFLFSVVRHRILKLLALVAAPVLILFAAIQVLSVPELRVAELVLLSYKENLLLSFIALPFLLMLIRLDFLIRHPVAGRRSFTLRLVTIASGAVTVALVILILVRPPFNITRPQPVTVTESIDYEAFTRQLLVESPAPLGEFTLDFLGESQSISSRARTWETDVERMPDVLSMRLNTVDFLDRNQARLFIDSPLPVEKLSIRFSADDPMTIYDAEFPYRLSPDRLSADVFVGSRPEMPLTISYTTTSNTRPRIEVVATSPMHPDPITLGKPLADVRSILTVRSVLNP